MSQVGSRVVSVLTQRGLWGWEALQKLSSETHISKAKVIWKSFELDPNASQACFSLHLRFVWRKLVQKLILVWLSGGENYKERLQIRFLLLAVWVPLWWRCMPVSRILLSRIHQGGCQSPDTEESDQIWHPPDIYKYSASASHLKWIGRERDGERPFLLLIIRK